MPSQLSLLIVEDDPGMRETLAASLSRAPAIGHIDLRADLAGARSALDVANYAIILIDVGLPDGSGLALLPECHALTPRPHCLILSAMNDEETIVQGIQLGADGYLLKQESEVDLVRALEDVMSGKPPLSPSVAQCIMRHVRGSPGPGMPSGDGPKLPPRQLETLTLLARGMTYEEIASGMGIAFNTVSSYAQEIYSKLAARSRSEAVYKAREMGIL